MVRSTGETDFHRTAGPFTRHVDNAMVKAIARAFRWRDMLESGEYATVREIANAEKINETYVGRVLRLTLLAPEVVEAIINGRHPVGLQLDGLMRRLPVGWWEQRATFISWGLARVFLAVACTRFRRHRVRCFHGTGGASWSVGSLRESSSLKLCG